MLSGRRLDLADPSPVDVEIEDIAHGLARVARWNGQTVGDHAFSVAQHSCLVLEIADVLNPDASPAQRQMALLHDALRRRDAEPRRDPILAGAQQLLQAPGGAAR